jgi:hypothetical protein
MNCGQLKGVKLITFGLSDKTFSKQEIRQRLQVYKFCTLITKVLSIMVLASIFVCWLGNEMSKDGQIITQHP